MLAPSYKSSRRSYDFQSQNSRTLAHARQVHCQVDRQRGQEPDDVHREIADVPDSAWNERLERLVQRGEDDPCSENRNATPPPELTGGQEEQEAEHEVLQDVEDLVALGDAEGRDFRP